MIVPKTRSPAGIYIPSNIFFDNIGSDILATGWKLFGSSISSMTE